MIKYKYQLEGLCMIVYIMMTLISIFFISLAYYFERNREIRYAYNNEKFIINKKIDYRYILCLVLAFLPLFLVSALRFDVGTDYYYVYTPHFYDIYNGTLNVYGEKPFIYLNVLLTKITTSSQILFILTSAIYVTFMALAIIKMSSNYLVSILVLVIGGFFFSSMNNVRQNVAVAIIAYAYYYAMNKKYIKMILLIMFASCFHIVAIGFIPLYLILSADKFRNIKNPIYLYIAILLLIIIALPISRIIFKNTKYIRYLEVDEGGRPVYTYIYQYSLLFIILLILSPLLEHNKYYQSLMYLLTFTLGVSLLSYYTRNTEATIRITCYSNWSLILLVPSILEINNYKYKCIKYVIVSTILMIMFSNTYQMIWYEGCFEVFPYQSIFLKRA